MARTTIQELTQEIRDTVLGSMDMRCEIADEELEQKILEEITSYSRTHSLTMAEKEQLFQLVFNSIRKLDILQELLDDPSITEVMVNGTNGIFYEKNGEIVEWEKRFSSKEKLLDVVQQIAGSSNRIVNESNPILDTRLSDGSRVNIVMEPASVDGAILSIRKFPKHPMTMQQLIQWGAISEEIVKFLSLLVKSGYNIFVSGGTGSGKTTFLNALSAYIPKSERVIVIEDSAELQIQGIPNLVRLETRQSRMEGVLAIDMRDLVKTSLRMRPDRIVVGEIRSGECLDLLQASNTGHRGTMSTGHSNSAADMLKRLETMVLMGMDLPLPAIRGQIASGIDIIVHLGRLRDRSRKLLEIVELDGMDGDTIRLNPLYRFQETGEKNGKVQGKWVKQNPMHHPEKLWECGYHLPEERDEKTA
ncbi:MAG: CpaF family protein [Lachnospiraceae bacterium]